MKNKDFEKNTQSKKFKKLFKKITFTEVITWSVISVFVLYLVILFVGLCNDDRQKQKDLEEVQNIPISSCVLTQNSNDSDKFILGVSGAGTLNTQYYFYIKKDIGYSLEHIEASCVEMVSTDEVEPHIEGHFDEHGNIITSLDLILSLDSDYMYEMSHYIMYVPSDYMVEEYTAKGITK